MRILIDENIPLMTREALCAMGHDVLDIRGSEREGNDDDALWTLAQLEERLLVTTDRGFARHRNKVHCGILIVCLRKPNRQKIHDCVMKAVGQFDPEDWRQLLVVIRDRVQSTWRAGHNK